jgi:response regulator RpfG family c-di-GMP phosphodiesterase
MPHTDGVTLLGWIREEAPDTVPVLLTGNGELETAVDAVNRGRIFRFLTKPCPPDLLRAAVTAANAQYLLVTAERVLLEQTLQGSVKALVDVLALAQPNAFGRALRVRRHVAELGARLELRDCWPVEIAAMLSQVGCAALSAASLDRFFSTGNITDDERAIIANLPTTAERLIAEIPRLECVREILRFQDMRFDGISGDPPLVGTVARDRLPVGARILKIALDFDLLEMRGLTSEDAMSTLRSRRGWYDPELLTAFAEQLDMGGDQREMQEMRLSQVRVGMVFAADVRSEQGMLLIARGQEVTPSVVERVRRQWQSFAPRSTVSMHVPSEAA